MDDSELLAATLTTTGSIIAGVAPEQGGLPTPCDGYDVDQLVDHLVGWAGSFAARLGGAPFEGEPAAYRSGPDPAGDFRTAAATISAAYRADTEASRALPLGVLLMEFLAHGWDLATATGQDAPFAPVAAERALAAGRQMLKPEYRGPDHAFGPEVAVPAEAGAVDRLVAYLGRDPSWRPA